jgi:hypothetical protein
MNHLHNVFELCMNGSFLGGEKRRSNPVEAQKVVRLPRFALAMLWVSAHGNDNLFVF